MILEGLLGNATAAKTLIYLGSNQEGYPRQIAQNFKIPVSQVQRQLERFELEGILASRLIGRTRVYAFNPRCFYLDELKNILNKAFQLLPNSQQDEISKSRKRPRRAGKPLSK